jgi:hypothetical protein
MQTSTGSPLFRDEDEIDKDLSTRPVLKPGLWMKIGELLGEQFRMLRSIPPEDPNHFGRINGREYQHCNIMRFGPPSDFNNYGPFNYEEVTERIISSSQVSMAYSYLFTGAQIEPYDKQLYSEVPAVLFDGAKPKDRIPVLSHVDAQHHNIMVKLIRNEEGLVVDVEEAILIDWERMSWMPSWYEAGIVCKNTMCSDDHISWLCRDWFRDMGHSNVGATCFCAMLMRSAALDQV